VELLLFDEVGEVLRGLVPPGLGELRQRSHRYGIKVWFDTDKAPREHYEAQVVGARHVPSARTLALEIGFHAEHPRPDDNQAAVDVLAAGRKRWRRSLGDEAEIAPFLGRDDWRRLSEIWADPDLSAPEMSLEIASRLTDYLVALEPLRR
jgi:hypothetical protein